MNSRRDRGGPGTRKWWQALLEADANTPNPMNSVASHAFQIYLFGLTDGAVRFLFFKTNSQLEFVEIADMFQLAGEEAVIF